MWPNATQWDYSDTASPHSTGISGRWEQMVGSLVWMLDYKYYLKSKLQDVTLKGVILIIISVTLIHWAWLSVLLSDFSPCFCCLCNMEEHCLLLLVLSLQEQLRRLYPRLKVLAFGAKPESTLHTYLPSFLSRATPHCPDDMKREVSSATLIFSIIFNKEDILEKSSLQEMWGSVFSFFFSVA